MTLEYRCSNCGALLQTTNADPLDAEIERLRAALTTARLFIKDEMIAHALVPQGNDLPDTWPSLLYVIDKALGVDEQKRDGI